MTAPSAILNFPGSEGTMTYCNSGGSAGGHISDLTLDSVSLVESGIIVDGTWETKLQTKVDTYNLAHVKVHGETLPNVRSDI